ncbi:MAG TPA: GNAT family N-acetyltransferase [Clostridia bacterium]|nr:GNAT family N-acetyltransferase [Clostridia bacterium]
MFELKGNIHVLKKFYNQEQIGFVFDSILEGNTPSEVYVDSVEAPNISLIWDKGHCFYFGGVTADEDAYSEGIEFFIDKFLNESTKQIIKIAKIYFISDIWESKLLELLQRFKPIIAPRSLYCHDLGSIPFVTTKIDNVEVRSINEELIQNESLNNIECMVEEITSMWGSPQRFLNKGFGCYALEGQNIACWCTAEYVSSTSCGIGIETIGEYQTKGIASATAAGFLNKCMQLKVTPYWDSWKRNTPSIKVAEKLGFKNVKDYRIILLQLIED